MAVETDPEIATPDLVNWLRWHEWAYSTYAECMGLPPRENEPVTWAVFDAGEDDPPIFTCDFEDDARALVAALRMLASQFDDTDTACPHGDPTCPCQDGDVCHYEGPDPMYCLLHRATHAGHES